jgi:hypothetical protein
LLSIGLNVNSVKERVFVFNAGQGAVGQSAGPAKTARDVSITLQRLASAAIPFIGRSEAAAIELCAGDAASSAGALEFFGNAGYGAGQGAGEAWLSRLVP